MAELQIERVMSRARCHFLSAWRDGITSAPRLFGVGATGARDWEKIQAKRTVALQLVGEQMQFVHAAANYFLQRSYRIYEMLRPRFLKIHMAGKEFACPNRPEGRMCSSLSQVS